MNESRIGSEKLPLKVDEHFINKVDGATASAHSITPDCIRPDAGLDGYYSVSEFGQHIPFAGGAL